MTRTKAVLLYDRDCAFCRWSANMILSWDTRRHLRPVALQEPEADRFLPKMRPDEKMATWHIVTPDGRVYSGGAAVPVLMRLLPGGRPLARVASAFPRATDAAYGWAARNRGLLARIFHAKAVRDRS